MSISLINENDPQKTPKRSSRLSQYRTHTEIRHPIKARTKSKSTRHAKSAKRSRKPARRRRVSRRKSWGRVKRRTGTSDVQIKNMLSKDYDLWYCVLGIRNVLNCSPLIVNIQDINLVNHSSDLNYIFVEKSPNKLSIKFVDYGKLFVQYVSKQKLNLINKIEWYSIIIHTLLTHNIFDDLLQTKRIDLVYNLLNVIKNLNEQRTDNIFGSLYFIKRLFDRFGNDKKKLYHMLAQQQQLKDLYTSKVKRANDKIELKRSFEALNKYEQYINYKEHFGIDEDHFGDMYDEYIRSNCVLHPKRNRKTIEKKHIKNMLNYFIHCMHLKDDENIILNKNINILKDQATQLIYEYGFWDNDVHACKKVEKFVLKNIMISIYGKEYDTDYDIDDDIHNKFCIFERFASQQ